VQYLDMLMKGKVQQDVEQKEREGPAYLEYDCLSSPIAVVSLTLRCRYFADTFKVYITTFSISCDDHVHSKITTRVSLPPNPNSPRIGMLVKSRDGKEDPRRPPLLPRLMPRLKVFGVPHVS
jgi:hypothetical protein